MLIDNIWLTSNFGELLKWVTLSKNNSEISFYYDLTLPRLRNLVLFAVSTNVDSGPRFAEVWLTSHNLKKGCDLLSQLENMGDLSLTD